VARKRSAISRGKTPVPLAAGPRRAAFIVARIAGYDARLGTLGMREKTRLLGESAFSFYRGTAHLFWHDITSGAQGPFAGGLGRFGGDAAHRTWICGDLHLNNLGVFADADGETVFGMNDFDEAVISDWQYDLWRLAPSLVLVARKRGDSLHDQNRLVRTMARAYVNAMAEYRGNEVAATRRFTAATTSGALATLIRQRAKVTRATMLERWTEVRKGRRVLATATNPELAPLKNSERAAVEKAWPRYVRRVAGGRDVFATLHTLSFARRLGAGIGARGLNRYYALVSGPHGAAPLDLNSERILDLKFQGEPAPWRCIHADERKLTAEASRGNHALRTIQALRACNQLADPYCGWLRLDDGTYAVRERVPSKAMLPYPALDTDVVTWIGTVVATAHARARLAVAEAICASTLRKVDAFAKSLGAAAIAYADLVERDHAAFRDHLAATEGA